jgi:hypothetical protein
MANKNIPSILRRRYQKAKEISQYAFDRVEINRNLYKGILQTDDTYEWDYSLVDPHVFPLVRNYLSRSNPSMDTLSLDVRRMADFENRIVNQQLINWEIGELMSTTLFYRMYFSAYLASRGYCKTGWKYEPAIEIQEKNELGEVTRFKVLRDIVNRPDAQFVRYNDILIPNPNNPLLHEQPYVIELIQQRVGDMVNENKSLEEHGEKPYWSKKFLNKIKKSGVSGKLLDYQMEMATDADSKDEMAFHSAYIAMMCMHTLEGDVYYMPLEDSEEIINDDTSNRYWHNHYPYIDFCPFPEDDEYHNLALVDTVGDLQIAATEVLNQTLTNIRSINNDMWVAGSAAAQTPDWQFKKRPDGVIRVMGDASQIQQIRTQDNTRSAMVFADSLQSKIERAGGISSLYSSGAPSQNINQTARGAQIIDQNIDTNMKMIIDLFGEQVLKRLGEHFLELNAQYITEEQTFAITGKRNVRELVAITPDQISANFIVSVNTDKIQKQTPASRQASLQNSITILQNIQTQAQGAIQVDLIPMIEALVDATPELSNVDEVVISVDEKSQRDIAMLERGQMPELKIRDAHEDLIMAANVHFTQNQESYPEEIKNLFEQYVMGHIEYIKAHKEMMMMAQPQMPMPAPMGDMGGAMGFDPGMADQQGLPNEGYNLGQIV